MKALSSRVPLDLATSLAKAASLRTGTLGALAFGKIAQLTRQLNHTATQFCAYVNKVFAKKLTATSPYALT